MAQHFRIRKCFVYFASVFCFFFVTAPNNLAVSGVFSNFCIFEGFSMFRKRNLHGEGGVEHVPAQVTFEVPS